MAPNERSQTNVSKPAVCFSQPRSKYPKRKIVPTTISPKENKNEMKDHGVVEKMKRFIPCNNELLLQISLRLIFNLTFDAELRAHMNECGMIPKFVEILKAPGFRALILKILYHLSQEDKLKATFTYTECIPLCFQLIIHCPEPIVGKELVALAINLTTNSRNSEIMAQEG